MPGADLTTRRDPITLLQPHVEHGDVGVEGRDAPHRLVLGARLADDDEIVLRLQQVADTTADDLVIIQQEHGHPIGHARQSSSQTCDSHRHRGPNSGHGMDRSNDDRLSRTNIVSDPAAGQAVRGGRQGRRSLPESCAGRQPGGGPRP